MWIPAAYAAALTRVTTGNTTPANISQTELCTNLIARNRRAAAIRSLSSLTV